ncbi:hypothetical protein [Alicyclobacillus fastidiosus]|uniref:Uncharacterized protein n=1 Tax=Alicyclobacillus fastidiosus TaxID=392011 RepID=A0ABV5AKG6_9BACL|nr:hypothetical protein [Alicyclobacillus fastidiosus]WEH08205.1 hypothetical protein PYS47_15985 [Alicyclobacillus fastidiosus]
MQIRTLNDRELDQIKAAKKAANDKLTDWRRSLRRNRKSLTTHERANLENNLAAHKRVTGKPVVVVVDGNEIYLNYELLQRFLKSLDRQRFTFYSFCVEGLGFSRRLSVSYGQPLYGRGYGVVEFFELPPRQRDLLSELPRVELIERF